MALMRVRRHIVLLLSAVIAACAPASGPERVTERRPSAAPAPRGAALLQRAMLDGHNAARAAAGVAPIAWDERLVASAAAYAAEMARTGRFQHAEQPIGGPLREGENLWTCTRGAYAYAEMVGHWVAERRDYVNEPAPAFSRTGRWQDVGHYAQIVWRGTTRMGCATSVNARDEYLVCRYYPAGNVVGQRAY
jgi:uncharacterized protein YkwD